MYRIEKMLELIIRVIKQATYFIFLWIIGNLVWHYTGSEIVHFLECIFRGFL